MTRTIWPPKAGYPEQSLPRTRRHRLPHRRRRVPGGANSHSSFGHRGRLTSRQRRRPHWGGVRRAGCRRHLHDHAFQRIGNLFTSRHSNLSRDGPDHRELRRRLELQSLTPVIAGQSYDLSGPAFGHRRRRDNAVRLSPANARLDDNGLCERAIPGYIWGDRPAPVHYCRHDHQSRRGVPDHVHRWDARLLRLHVRVRTGNTHACHRQRPTISLQISDSDSLLRVQRYSYRFGHLCRRHRQLLVHSVHPDGRFRFLRRKRQPEHFPGHLLRERHVFGRRQFHGLVIERELTVPGTVALSTGNTGNGAGTSSAPGGVIGTSPTSSQNTVSLASAQSSAQTYEDDASVSQQTQLELENQAHIQSLLSGPLQRQAAANANRTGSTQGGGTSSPPGASASSQGKERRWAARPSYRWFSGVFFREPRRHESGRQQERTARSRLDPRPRARVLCADCH